MTGFLNKRTMGRKIILGFGIMLASVYVYSKMTSPRQISSSDELTKQISSQVIDLELSPAKQEDKIKIWASMGLCYSHNTNKHGKKKYPYKQVLPLALLLWRYHLPQVNTIVRIVHTEPELTYEMRSYGAMLERTGAVVEWVPAGNMSCVTMSQIVRMFAGDNAAVAETDIVLAVDANLFVMSPEIIHPLTSSPDMKAWILNWNYENYTGRGQYFTIHYQNTFNMNLLAMKPSTWREVTGYNGSIEGLVKYYREEGRVLNRQRRWEGPESAKEWYIDQRIITWALLSSKICSVPAKSNLWEMPGIKFDPALDDSKTCFHGFGYENCTKRRVERIWRMGCKWWHFFPNEDFQSHLDKFYELTRNTVTLDPEILGQ